MRNITVSIPDDLARWARVWAAKHETSVSGLLSCLLQEKREQVTHYESAYQEFLAEKPQPLSGNEVYPTREALYDR